jgi:hypothetical protein
MLLHLDVDLYLAQQFDCLRQKPPAPRRVCAESFPVVTRKPQWVAPVLADAVRKRSSSYSPAHSKEQNIKKEMMPAAGNGQPPRCEHTPVKKLSKAPPLPGFNPMVQPHLHATYELPALPQEVREKLFELHAEITAFMRTQHLQTLVLCGVESGNGASFIAAHLSRVLAEFARLKVALLTVVPASGERKALPSADFEHVQVFLLRRTEKANLVEIVAPHGAVTLPDVLYGCNTPQLMRQLKAAFDLIVIDAPAITTSAEAALLAASADGVLLVAQQHATTLRRLDQAHQRLRKVRAVILGMIFNRSR